MLQYQYMHLEYNDKNSTQEHIEVRIVLQRILTNHITSTFLPTLCIIIIAGLTLFIDVRHFEATIMVALTSMLVMYTLYQSISETLPHTAYMKMIDIWLFCGLIFPFVIICALTILDYMIIKENDRRNTNLAGQNKQIWNSKKALKSMQIILPTMTGIDTMYDFHNSTDTLKF